MKFLIFLCSVFVGTVADPKAEPLNFRINDLPVEDEAQSYNKLPNSGQTVVHGSSGGYVYQQPPAPVTYTSGSRGSVSCSCPPPTVIPHDITLEVAMPDIKTAHYVDQPFPVHLKEITEVPKYNRTPIKREYEIKRINITEREIKKYTPPVLLKKKCEKPKYQEERKTKYIKKPFRVTVDHIIERPVYEEIYNIKYKDVPVDVVINKVIQRPLPKPIIKIKYVDVEIENIIEEIQEKEVNVTLTRKVEKAKYIDKHYDLTEIPYVKVECIPKLVPQCISSPPCPSSGLRCPACDCPQTGTVYLPPSPVYLHSHGK